MMMMMGSEDLQDVFMCIIQAYHSSVSAENEGLKQIFQYGRGHG